MSLGIGGLQGRKGIKASQPLRIASFPLLAAFFGYLLLLLTEGDKKKRNYTQINGQGGQIHYFVQKAGTSSVLPAAPSSRVVEDVDPYKNKTKTSRLCA